MFIRGHSALTQAMNHEALAAKRREGKLFLRQLFRVNRLRTFRQRRRPARQNFGKAAKDFF
jgi:hypothetical protein